MAYRKHHKLEAQAAEKLGALISRRRWLEDAIANPDAGAVAGVFTENRRQVAIPQITLWGRELVEVIDAEEEALAELQELIAKGG